MTGPWCLRQRQRCFASSTGDCWPKNRQFSVICARHSIDEILNGVDVDGIRVDLNPTDKRACLEQCILLRGAASAEMLNFLWEPQQIANCRGVQCQHTRFLWRKRVEKRRTVHLPLTLWRDSDWDDLDVCDICLAAMKANHQRVSDNFWDCLPQRFGLASWEELGKMKQNVMGS
ncbi:hypothetical protein DFH06DRAFT_1181282 [Mycena polygramma]|nr:hypothetical protein DFH06DRAFT_1181282 [Mycena polygramma]